MAKGNTIVLSSPPRGKFEEGIIDDTSKPGTCMEQVPNSTFSGGRSHWRASSAAAGAKGPRAVLREDAMQGQLPTVAYAVGSRCFVYYPAAGEELNCLLGDVVGTGDIVTQGDLFGVNNNGKMIANSAYTSTPFQAQESLAALTADTLVWVRYRGDQA